MIGSAFGCSHDPDFIRVQAKAWSERCDPPFTEWEKHFYGIAKKEKRNNTHHLSPVGNPVPPLSCPVSERKNSVEAIETDESNSFIHSTALNESPSTEKDEPCLVKSERCEVKNVVKQTPNTDYLHPDAFHGPLGKVVKAVSPHTEADDPALLICLLASFGNAVGLNPHFNHGKRHGANLFIGLVGPTACRKGTATTIAKTIIADADTEWESRVQHEGFGSGEGLIWSVRDPNPTDPVGITDKRLLVIEEEWAKTFTLSASDKSILTPIIRGAYDRIPIGKRNKGDNSYGCREPHISIIGNITPDDLRQSLTGKMAVSIANGFLNRFLLVAMIRTKYLPRDGMWNEHAKPFISIISEAISNAKTRNLMSLDRETETVWDNLYRTLETRPDGVQGAVTGRASDMVMKLAKIYALADEDESIRVQHLKAGLAIWRYCESTAFALFGGVQGKGEAIANPEPDPLWHLLLNAIIQSNGEGVSKTNLIRSHQRHGNAEAIGESLERLKEKRLAYSTMVKVEGSGRPSEKWYAGSGDGGKVEPNNNHHLLPLTSPPSPDAMGDADEPVSERKNSNDDPNSFIHSTPLSEPLPDTSNSFSGLEIEGSKNMVDEPESDEDVDEPITLVEDVKKNE